MCDDLKLERHRAPLCYRYVIAPFDLKWAGCSGLISGAPMVKNTLIVISVCAVVSVMATGCARLERAEMAREAQASMVGMSKAQVLSCMGVAQAKQVEDDIEVWQYAAGGDQTGIATAFATGQDITTAIGSSKRRYCIINVVMQDGHVTSVNYTGRTGGLITQGEQCGFAISNCVD